MSRELDEQCARALGWRDVRRSSGVAWDAGGDEGCVVARVAVDYYLFGTNPQTKLDSLIPSFSESHISARLLEDEIERRGLQEKYLSALVGEEPDLLFHNSWYREWRFSVEELWIFQRATPEQRAKAFLEAIK